MNKIKGADGLRAFACLLVMASHFISRIDPSILPPWGQALQAFLLQGGAGVTVFFVLSGFLLALPFWLSWFRGEDLPSLKIYAMRRFGRIAPGFWLNLALTFIIAWFLVPDAPSITSRYHAGLSFTSSLSWLSFFPVEINGPLWSIGFEVFSYLLLPLGMILLFSLLGKTAPGDKPPRKALPAMIFWILILLAVLYANGVFNDLARPDDVMRGWEYGLSGGGKFWWPNYNPLGFFAQYLIGVLAAGLYLWLEQDPRRDKIFRTFLVWDLLALLGLASFLGLMVQGTSQPEFSNSFQRQPYQFPFMTLSAALMLLALARSRFAVILADNPPARYLAKISFGLYIWHYLIMETYRLMGNPDFDWMRGSSLELWGFRTAGLATLALVFASLSWYFLEKPILQKAQDWKPDQPGQPGKRLSLMPWTVGTMVILGLLFTLPWLMEFLFPH